MVNKAKAKGYRTVATITKVLKEQGYIVRNLEKTGKFAKEKDLFGLWDLIALKNKEHMFIQAKTNLVIGKKRYRKWLHPFINFGKEHGSNIVKYQVWIKYDRKGLKVVECL